jgi:acyl-coenzyme A synthetase/AMP-(fatty) acid ligase
MWQALAAAHAHLGHLLHWGGADSLDALPWADDAGRQRLVQAERAAAVSANDVFTICWTSGTEAVPKGVPRSHNEWMVVAPSIIEAADLQAGARLLNPFPLINMAGLSTAFVTWLVLGATVVQHQSHRLGLGAALAVDGAGL